MTQNKLWLNRWKDNRIGFHQNDVNESLKMYASRLLSKSSHVFVPLAGKSRDMWWLKEQGVDVVGNELSDIAVRAFFEEHNLPYQTKEIKDFTHYSSDNIDIFCGDFFALKHEHIASCTAVFDRAALIALPSDMRTTYARTMMTLLPAKSKMLLITLEYDEPEIKEPPFSVSLEEIKQLYNQAFLIENLSLISCEPSKRLQEKGVKTMQERVTFLTGEI